MEACLDDKNWEKLSKLAHQIKPTYTLLGLDAVRESLLYIELEGKKKEKLNELPDITRKFIMQSKSVIPDLEKELA
jgi:hypothetical protein